MARLKPTLSFSFRPHAPAGQGVHPHRREALHPALPEETGRGREEPARRRRIAPVLFGAVSSAAFACLAPMPTATGHRRRACDETSRAAGPKTASTTSGACFRIAPAPAFGCGKHLASTRSVCGRAHRDRCLFQRQVQSGILIHGCSPRNPLLRKPGQAKTYVDPREVSHGLAPQESGASPP
ncbi:MAG: hypothetical protein DLM68_02780 [Hyphomicrobiales bacterium]|nr:MAG: hypothetical protein DLM68_02780 [Hyphomicrobiales bacterium]